MKRLVKGLLIVGVLSLNVTASSFIPVPSGVYLPHTASMAGDWDLSMGMHFWHDHFNLRNLQFRNTTFISPGLRMTSVLRSNYDLLHVSTWNPKVDELYMEWLGYYTDINQQFSWSAKLGETRYLRSPNPDITSMFDQVPGVEDLEGRGQTSYKGLILSIEETLVSGFGAHGSWINWMGSDQTGLNSIESYLFYRTKLYWIDTEVRWGVLANRVFPLGTGSSGYSLYLGGHLGPFNKVGFLYEYNETEGIRTGILVEFDPNPVTEFIGEYRGDFTRSPQFGLGMQPTILKGSYGYLDKAPLGAVEVGILKTERTITYWQNGQGRNFYEHIVSQKGKTSGPGLVVVKEEGQRYLRIESLVSPHNRFQNWDDLVEWEKDRQGPAQLAQPVTYWFYRVPASRSSNE
ncbi:hypothetical protein HOH87_08475 [bacterium]|jgi:hypothetical protein|nr:hypothetical protein [bacterium]